MIQPREKLVLDFTVKAVVGGEVRDVRFADLLRRRTIVSAYMRNNTPSCDRQVASLAAQVPAFAEAGFDVIAVSRDTAGSHRKVAAKLNAPLTLVSDPDDRFATAADSLVPKILYGRKFVGPQRSAWILEPDGTVLATIEKVDTADHTAQLQAAIKSL